ncbi:MAG: hypothetical protein E7351_00560 [Clostridiales bacterium]|nr:hypothetical protein [Clostridiales bacterium]
MFEIFKPVSNFFDQLSDYVTYNEVFIVSIALFLFIMLAVIISTSRSYEARLIKAIDMFNTYFIDNPQITEENLVAFNAKMKTRKVPKQLRKQWQQFVLYREDKASHYMSFENCVSNPIKNSTYKRDITIMNILAYIVAGISLLLNCFYAYEGAGEGADFGMVLQNVLLSPVIVLLINWIVTIFLDLRHNAIVSDLYQNYQYFEVNIDKATQTLPEYVDYEVLFDRQEIKKGIPILYAYLQKRAEEEQRELERARLKNVEHEKFNFDEAGVAGSLVLERAMQEAENYIAERKKYNQDTQQINSDITQEDMNYREITKEYNRQMQVSKETFANFKSQLEEVSSTIEANYLKKQQQQELDRQRNLERDFDTATERHKKVIESYHAELDSVDKFIAESRKSLEDAMMSEFATYSGKVYDEAKKVVEEREKAKHNKLKNEIKSLEERLISKDQELDKVYEQLQALNDRLAQMGDVPTDTYTQPEPENYEPQYLNEEVSPEESIVQYPAYDQNASAELTEFPNEIPEYQEPVYSEEQGVESLEPIYTETNISTDPIEEKVVQGATESKGQDEQKPILTVDDVINNYYAQKKAAEESLPEMQAEVKEEKVEKKKAGRPRKVVTEVATTEKKKPGRPRKEKQAETQPKKGPGRPKKVTSETAEEKPVKKGRGRPRKVQIATANEPKKGRGRPKKQVSVEEKVNTEKKKRGRPKKEVAKTENVAPVKKGRGRPRKVQVAEANTEPKRGRGRPRKTDSIPQDISDIDAYLKEIDDAIAKENAKLEENQKELAKKAKIAKNKK